MPADEAISIGKLLYCIVLVSVFVAKWIAHSPSKTQYSMLDYCYSVNVLLVAWLVGMPLPEVPTMPTTQN